MQSQQQMVERSARSIFVGNISYDVTEDELRKLLSAVIFLGPAKLI